MAAGFAVAATGAGERPLLLCTVNNKQQQLEVVGVVGQVRMLKLEAECKASLACRHFAASGPAVPWPRTQTTSAQGFKHLQDVCNYYLPAVTVQVKLETAGSQRPVAVQV